MVILGLDIASKTGAVLLEDQEVLFAGTIVTKKKKGALTRMPQCHYLAKECLSLAAQADLVVVEDYAISFRGAAIALVELGAIVRFLLWEKSIRFIDVPPKTLKKFVTGKGTASKSQMMIAVSSRWSFDPMDDNVADAYGLAKIGQALTSMRTDESLFSLREKYGYI